MKKIFKSIYNIYKINCTFIFGSSIYSRAYNLAYFILSYLNQPLQWLIEVDHKTKTIYKHE